MSKIIATALTALAATSITLTTAAVASATPGVGLTPAIADVSWLNTGSVGEPGTTPCLTYPETSVIGWACTEEDKDQIRDARRARAAERRAEREAAKAEAWEEFDRVAGR